MIFFHHEKPASSDRPLLHSPPTARMILMLFCAYVLHGEAFVPCKTTSQHKTLLSEASSREEEARRLKEQAERIRSEVASFEQQKQDIARQEEEKQKKMLSEKQQERLRYSAELPILKGDGSTVVERVDFAPRIKDGSSRIEVCTASLPLGIILGESEEYPGAVCVDEVGIGSNGELAGVQEGDLLRACTACQMTMETPTWQVIAGGIGRPKTKRFVYSVDGRPFEQVMEAVASNRMDPEERPLILVLERQ